MEIVDIRDEYQEETGKTAMELTDCDLGERHTMEYVAWIESKLKNHGVIGDVSDCDLCNGIGYISVDNMVVECHSC